MAPNDTSKPLPSIPKLAFDLPPPSSTSSAISDAVSAPDTMAPVNTTAEADASGNQPRAGIVIFSGGSAANKLVDVFEEVRRENDASLTYVVPISDNGGSSSEIIRVFGGPGIGDVRSRLVRLIPNNPTAESSAVRSLFNHRLPAEAALATAEWDTILSGSHPLWVGISTPKLQMIRSIFNTFNSEAIKRTRPSSRFDFARASLGNVFLTGARLFTGSFEAAIWLLSQICEVPRVVDVVPSLHTNFAHHIAAGLENGEVIMGQNNISHPSETSAINLTCQAGDEENESTDEDVHDPDDEQAEDANLPGSLLTLRQAAIAFSKEHEEDLPSRISRLWYINPYGQEIRISANPRALSAIDNADTVIFSIGSLFTSIVPSLVLKGVGTALSQRHVRNKILILNATIDRETGPSATPFTAADFVRAIADACLQSIKRGGDRGRRAGDDFECSRFVTHLVYLDAPGAPVVEREVLQKMGVECVRCYGPKGASRYDDAALGQALRAIMGRRRGSSRIRRNTMSGCGLDREREI